MKKKPHATLAMLAGTLLLMAVPTCYFIAEQNNPNDPKNLNEYMGLPVADTGQTLCYDASGNTIACDEGVGGYPRQDGFYVNKPNARLFTGPTQHPIYTSDYTTNDNLTGLVWKSCSEGLSGSNCGTGAATAYNWNNALEACIVLNSLNGGLGYAGRKTWRLPTIQELKSIINYGAASPAIDAIRFPGTASYYWSSNKYIPSSNNAWGVSFDAGFVRTDPLTDTNYVRCVSDRL
ncbi:MAG TPA: DUF1566 domain-containing protein [Spirochaetota bacterium]|nr:DUF1566 domain-containing protein [Spirochaetota bacterium]